VNDLWANLIGILLALLGIVHAGTIVQVISSLKNTNDAEIPTGLNISID
jgi:hypothetical protein